MGNFMRCLAWLLIAVLQLQGNYAADNAAEPTKCLAPQECCRYPQVFKENAFDYCKDKLGMNWFSSFLNNSFGVCWFGSCPSKLCFLDCVYEATEICRWEQCDNRKAVDYVDWVWPEEHDFKTEYKQAFKLCIAKVTNGTDGVLNRDKKECDPQPERVQQCVEHELFTLCPAEYFNNDKPECVEQRKYWDKC